MKKLFLLIFVLLTPPALADMPCEEEPCFEQLWQEGGETYPLIGSGKFKVYFFSVFKAAFFGDPEPFLRNGPMGVYPKKLELHYLRKLSREDLVEAASDYFKEHDRRLLSKFPKELAAINKLYRDVGKGDSYSLSYIPKDGLTLKRNNKFVGKISGDEFAMRYFGIWLSPKSKLEKIHDNLFGRNR